MGVYTNLKLKTHTHKYTRMKFTACLLLSLLALSQANPVPQMVEEECDDLDAQAAIAEPLDEMRFFPEMIEAEQELMEEDDCEEVEVPQDLHYAAASMAGQNEMDYLVNDECDEENAEESEDFAFGYTEEETEIFNVDDYNGNAEPNPIEDVECEGDEEVEQEFRGDYETEDLGILENAEFAQVDQSAVKMLDGETDAAEIEECEEEY